MASGSITVTLDGNPTTVTLRPDTVELLLTLASTGDPSEELAYWLVGRINEGLGAKLRTDIAIDGHPALIKDEDISG